MATRRLKRLVIIGAVVAGVVIAEVMLRLVEKTPEEETPPAYQVCLTTLDGRRLSPHTGGLQLVLSPYTFWKNRPNVKTNAFSINAMSLRGREISALTHGRTRIVMLGNSALFGLGVPGDADTLPSRLEALAPDWDVVNAGVALFQSGQELSYFLTELVDLGPSIVVAYDGWSDAFEAVYGSERGAIVPGFNIGVLLLIQDLLAAHAVREKDVGANLARLMRSLSAHSRILAAIRDRLPERTPSGPADAGAGGPDKIPPPRASIASAVAAYAGNMAKLNEICRARGIRFLVALQPELGQKQALTQEERAALERGLGQYTSYAAEFPERYRQFRRDAAETLREWGVSVIDVGDDPAFARAPATLFYDVVHPTPEGHRIAAGIIRQALAR